jgi:hypothetical protein
MLLYWRRSHFDHLMTLPNSHIYFCHLASIFRHLAFCSCEFGFPGGENVHDIAVGRGPIDPVAKAVLRHQAIANKMTILGAHFPQRGRENIGDCAYSRRAQWRDDASL